MVASAGPIKVAYVVLALNMGGLERVVLRLVARLDRTRFEPVVCALDEPGGLAPDLARLGVPLVVVHRNPGVDLGVAVRLARILRREGVRVVHTHNAASHLYGSLAAHVLRLRTGKRPPVVHTKHGRDEPGNPRRVLLHRFSSAICDRVVAVSDDAASVAIRIEHVSPRKVMTILNGVDTDEFRPRPEQAEARAALGAPIDGFHVGCVARLATVKDHATLVEAFARFRAARPDAHLTLIGDGPERAALEKQVEGAAVTFTGALPRREALAWVAAADVLLHPSAVEAAPTVVREARALGVPVVACDAGDVAAWARDDAGIRVAAASPDGLARALEAVLEAVLDAGGDASARKPCNPSRFD